MALGIQSFLQQRETVRSLRTANTLLVAERVATELERTAALDAERVLHDLAIAKLRSVLTGPVTSKAAATVLYLSADLAARNPAFGELYLMQRGRVLYPPTAARTTVQKRIVRRLERDFEILHRVHEGEIYPLALNEPPYAQLFYTPISAVPGNERLLLLCLDLEGIRATTLSGAAKRARSLGAARLLDVRSKPQPHSVTMKTIYPFWRLSVDPSEADPSPNRDILVFGGSICAVVVTLALGITLLLRDNWRQWRMNQLRTGLVTAISHDLRGPLSVIRLYSETLLHKTNFPEQERGHFYKALVDESGRLSRLVEEVLDFSRLECGGVRYEMTEGDLVTTVGRVVASHQTLLHQRGFTIHVDLQPTLPPVRFDASAVSQAVYNLLENATKYSGDSKLIDVRLSLEANHVVFSVRDFGPGIPVELRPRIFDPFYRIPDSGFRGGYGLGLFLVRNIMSAHRGTVELLDPDGPGVEFCLRFPCSKS